MDNFITKKEYSDLLKSIKQRIHAAQYEALKRVNKELVQLYWDIGQMIVGRQKGKTWGKAVVEKLSKDLQLEFPGIKSFSSRNIWYMRIFFLCYCSNEKLQPMVAEIGWTHNLIIMEKCKEDLQREFYIRFTRKFGWTKNILIHQIENQTYEKTMLSQTNFDQTLPENIQNQAKLAVRDEYVFDFLELGNEHSERELQRTIISKVERFLREMGGMFAFLGSQYRLEINNEEYFIDLLLYHRALKCLVAIDLKVGKFIPEHIGKMQFYLAVIDDKVRMADENSSIGIILCKTKDKIIVEYALRESNKPIGVAEYKIVKTLPDEMKNLLPTSEQIEHLLEEI